MLLDNGQNLVMNRGPDSGPKESWLITHNGEQFDTADLASLESLVKRLSSPTMEADGDDPGEDFRWKDYDELSEPPSDADAPPEEPTSKKKRTKRKKRRVNPKIPQVKTVTLNNDDYRIILTVRQPTGHRG